MSEKAPVILHLYCPKELIDETYTTKPMTTEELDKLINSLTNPTEDVIVERKRVLVQQQEYTPDKVVLKKSLLEKPMLIEIGIYEKENI
jgi:arsenate reductase-like glutaredoxin family protein